MPRTAYFPAVILALACSVISTAQDAVQWRADDGGNGHWYALVDIANCGSDFSSLNTCVNSEGAHLVTLDSSQETDFLTARLVTNVPGRGSLIGAYTDSPLPGGEADDAEWRWVTDEPWSYTNWAESCCPTGNENYVYMFDQFDNYEPGSWDDCPWGYVPTALIEWSADCDGDGIVDYGQILDGSREDVDGNGVPDCCEDAGPCPCPADLDGDGQVRAGDLGILLSLWGTDGGKRPGADLDGSGIVDAADLGLMIATWGACL